MVWYGLWWQCGANLEFGIPNGQRFTKRIRSRFFHVQVVHKLGGMAVCKISTGNPRAIVLDVKPWRRMQSNGKNGIITVRQNVPEQER